MCMVEGSTDAIWHQSRLARLNRPSTSRNLAGRGLRGSRMKSARRLQRSVQCTIKSTRDAASKSYPSPKWKHPWLLHAARQIGLITAQGRAACTEASSTSDAATVLLVESPAKARKIQAFLGSNYKVRYWDLVTPSCAVVSSKPALHRFLLDLCTTGAGESWACAGPACQARLCAAGAGLCH